MNKEIEQMMLTVPQKIVAYDSNPAGQHLYGEQRQEIAEALYNAGYRKTFTSDLASDAQKAYKEGYIKGIEEREAENERLTERLKQVLLSIDTVKEMNAMCNIDEQRKQAVKEFAGKLQKELPCRDYTFNGTTYSMVLTSNIKYVIDKLLKEYEK